MNEKAHDRTLLDSFARRFVPRALICDAGCGPSAHIGRYLADKGLTVIGVDISDRCVDMASALHPDMQFRREDIANEFSGIQAGIYSSFFHEREIEGYYRKAGFALEFLERRSPYDFEIEKERISAIGRKTPKGEDLHVSC